MVCWWNLRVNDEPDSTKPLLDQVVMSSLPPKLNRLFPYEMMSFTHLLKHAIIYKYDLCIYIIYIFLYVHVFVWFDANICTSLVKKKPVLLSDLSAPLAWVIWAEDGCDTYWDFTSDVKAPEVVWIFFPWDLVWASASSRKNGGWCDSLSIMMIFFFCL